MAIGKDNGSAFDLQLGPDGQGLSQGYDLTHQGQPSNRHHPLTPTANKGAVPFTAPIVLDKLQSGKRAKP
jgi:hypothetical protein